MEEASSWSEYEKHRNNTINDEGEASKTSKEMSIRKTADLESLTKTGPESNRVGIEALYEEATAGIDTKLQFQWMRPHPSTVFVTRESKGNAVAEELAGLADGPSDSVKGEGRDDSGFTATGFEMDPGDLFAPPLLSEWLPGIGADCDLGSEDGHDSESDGDPAEDPLDVPSAASILGALLDASVEERTSNNDLLRSVLGPLASLSFETLSETLPSRRVLESVLSIKADPMSVGARTLALLAEHCGSVHMGKYILRILAPVLLRSSNYPVANSPSDVECRRGTIRTLSRAILNACRLEGFTRSALSDLLSPPDGSDDGIDSGEDLMDELRCCVGEEYFRGK